MDFQPNQRTRIISWMFSIFLTLTNKELMSSIRILNCQSIFICFCCFFFSNFGYDRILFTITVRNKNNQFKIKIVFIKVQVMLLSVMEWGVSILFTFVSPCFKFDSLIYSNFCSFCVSFFCRWWFVFVLYL